MYEQWEIAGNSLKGDDFEIVADVRVWDHQWYKDGGPNIQVGKSSTGPFEYFPVYVILIDDEPIVQRIVFGAAEVRMDYWRFARRLT
jgi:hypothetical protein